MATDHTIAVALHDVEPATFERCALIRDWLADHGVDRVTLLVIPAQDLHPLGERSPEMVDWLVERRHLGDSIAQHGFQHQHLRRTGRAQRFGSLTVRSSRTAEFVGLDGAETRSAVESGWRLLKLAGIEPDGFVAPAYAYTRALHRTLGVRFRWWASLLSLHGAALVTEPVESAEESRRWRRLAPAWTLRGEGQVERALSPALVRAGAAFAGATLRLDLHPDDLDHPRQMLALEWALAHSSDRRAAVTYDELAAGKHTDALDLPRTQRPATLRTS